MTKVDRLPFDPGPAAWNEILAPQTHYPALEGKHTADWLIIGGGFAGLSAARRLQQLHPKDRVILLEARRIGEGPAGRNSGFMIDLPHNLASQDYAGALDDDRIQTAMNRKAIEFALQASEEFGFSPDAVVKSGKVNAAASDKGVQHNLDYSSHLKELGEKNQLLDAAQMRDLCGSSYYRQGLFTPGTAMLQPALYIRELAGAISRPGVDILENSPVTEMEKTAGVWTAKTRNGSVQAPRVILAVNGHVESFGHYQKRLMHIYLYASMTRPLSAEEDRQSGGEAGWAFTPADPMGTTLRKVATPQGSRIIVRNRFTWAPSRSVDPGKINTIADVHDRSFIARFPRLGAVGMEYRWGGLLCLSMNNVTAFGEIDEGLYSACCQNGLGTAKGTSQGVLAAELASGLQSEHLDYLLNQEQPKRLPPEPFSSIGANAYMRYGEWKAGLEL